MTRRNMNQIIEDSIREGYELLAEGSGLYDEKVKEYRDQGYDVRYWYVVRGTVEERRWIIYGKKKVRAARKPVAKIDYSQLTVKELRELCKEKKIAGYSKLSKSEIISRLEAC